MAPTSPRPAGGWYYGWNIVAVGILSQLAANGLTYNCFPLFLKNWSADLHVQISQVQLALAAMTILAAVFSPVVGTLADKYPARRIFSAGLLGMALFYALISVTTAVWQIQALYGLLVPIALCFATAIPVNALISRWFVRRLGLALGLSAFGIGMAGVLLPPIIAAILPTVGWRMIWRGGALLLVLVVMPTVLLVIRDKPTEREGLHYLEGGASAQRRHGHGTHGASQMSWRDVVGRRNFWLLVAIYLPMLALSGGVQQNLPPYVELHGLSSQAAGNLLSALNLSHVVATLVLGFVSDRFGNRLPFTGLAVIMVTGAALLAFGSGLPVITVGCMLIGFGGGLFTLLPAALAVEFGAEGVGRAFGMCMLFIPVSSLAPFAVAKIKESTGSYAPGLLALGAIVVVSGVMSLMLRERHGGHATEAEKEAAVAEAVSPVA
jgi:MFS family permease